MEDFIYGIVPYGYCQCSVKHCFQRVQDRKEFQTAKKPMCYAHAKMRDKLFSHPNDYLTERQYQSQNWDLRVV